MPLMVDGGMHNAWFSQAMHDEVTIGLFRWNDVGHVEECNLQGFRRAELHTTIYPG
jgi:hypothetical protein